MLISDIFTAQNEIVSLLRTKMPDYSKNILPLFDEDEIAKNANFSPSIFVAYLGLSTNDNDTIPIIRQHAKIEQVFGVFTVFRDARGNAKVNGVAGGIMMQCLTALQGFKPTGYAFPLALTQTPRQYDIKDTGAVCYPLIFKTHFILSGG